MQKLNYKSVDGNFYRLTECEKGHLKSDSGTMLEVTMSDVKHYFIFEKLNNEDKVIPIIRIGLDKRRCPNCWETNCFLNHYGISDLGMFEVHSSSGKKNYIRLISKCLRPMLKENKYFIVEYNIDQSNDIGAMLTTKSCLVCNVKNRFTVNSKIIYGKKVKYLYVSIDCKGCYLLYGWNEPIAPANYFNGECLIDPSHKIIKNFQGVVGGEKITIYRCATCKENYVISSENSENWHIEELGTQYFHKLTVKPFESSVR